MAASLRGRHNTGASDIDDRRRKLRNAGSGGFALFVANPPFDCNHEDTYKFFQRYGKVLDVHIPCFPNSSRPRVFAFVRFQYEEEGRAAMGVLNGRKMDGRSVRVEIARKRVNPPDILVPKTGPRPSNPLAHIPHPRSNPRPAYPANPISKQSRPSFAEATKYPSSAPNPLPKYPNPPEDYITNADKQAVKTKLTQLKFALVGKALSNMISII
ncbi:serine/arginine-rich splicing factor SC35-like [Magnolia sinica]|uniref:serine/arginine-rich splicing factor SC35-like n=1 Tax=Magnolia sinica TaxID=86752 RepID=UPI002659FC36|nr:serine/arginine-rich splicing factor SC35-like [Magnolia sinica]